MQVEKEQFGSLSAKHYPERLDMLYKWYQPGTFFKKTVILIILLMIFTYSIFNKAEVLGVMIGIMIYVKAYELFAFYLNSTRILLGKDNIIVESGPITFSKVVEIQTRDFNKLYILLGEHGWEIGVIKDQDVRVAILNELRDVSEARYIEKKISGFFDHLEKTPVDCRYA
ncbi:MAG: hypothetical protein OEZ39_09260 [Gammaproteobacteria bacterium]|nr:hypothetical protein [Gammaproteobacteria bacterium]MDH5652032.1 hypothetical protein [Gammaproteobacteria bacterium]